MDGRYARPKRGGAMLVNVPYLDNSVPLVSFSEPLPVTIFRTGAIVSWGQQFAGSAPLRNEEGGGMIQGMSIKSRLRAAWAFGNAPLPWFAMLTLTFSEQPNEPKAAFDTLTRAMRHKFGKDGQWGWLMEYQSRGVVHYHIFFGADWLARFESLGSIRHEVVVRNGKRTSLLRGAADDWFVAQWSRAADDHTEEFRRFQAGGILEAFRDGNAAAKYVAKEATKREQKALPEGVNGGHRWWWLSPAGKAIPIATCKLVSWPLRQPLSRVFDKGQIAESIIDYEPVKGPSKRYVTKAYFIDNKDQ